MSVRGTSASIGATYDVDIEAARARLDGVAHRTPVFTSRTLDEQLGGRLYLKAENLQRAGAFKFRGAYNRIATLTPGDRARGVVTSSSGNHAQAVALAARMRDTTATVLMPRDAPASKRLATLGYGAEVILFDRYSDERDEEAVQVAQGRGLTLVHAYDDLEVIAGAGTVAWELLDEVGELDLLVVCTGGGGLLAGCARVARGRYRDMRVVGVEPIASDDWQQSLQAGKRVSVHVDPTIADGQQVPSPGEITFAIAHPLVDEIVTVGDAEIVDAMRVLFERCKIVAEPSGATGFAAVLTRRIDVRGLRVGIIISGGNVDARRFTALLSEVVRAPA